MCRRCGETDKRGSAHARRRRKQWLLDTYGDGTTVECPLRLSAACKRTLTFATLQVDRLIPGRDGGTYRRSNIQPACGPCNRARTAVRVATQPAAITGYGVATVNLPDGTAHHFGISVQAGA